MFEKNTRFRVRRLLENEFANIQLFEKTVINSDTPVIIASSPNERNMTRKTRSRQLRIHSAFQSGYCAICHIPYNSLSDHIQTKRHLKLIGDDSNFISLKGFDDQDTLLSLDGIDTNIDVKNCDVSPYFTRTKMPKTRTSLMNSVKDSSLSPTINDSGHHLRSRKNINYMTPPLDDDNSSEKSEIKEYRELRSSSRLLAKLTDQIVTTDDAWNSGRPKRSCNRQRISADERLVADNKTYYNVEVLSSKLRSGVHLQYNQPNNKRAGTPAPSHRLPPPPLPPPPPPPPPLNSQNEKSDDKGLIAKFKKLRNSELVRLNNEAENFLFPKKDESCDDTEDDDDDDDNEVEKNLDNNSDKNHDISSEIDESKLDNNSLSNDSCFNKKIKIEDDESSHSNGSDGRMRKRRRTHAEAFIMDNQKYYKFETPGSSCYRLRYHGSYLSPVGWKPKHNGDVIDSIEKQMNNEISTAPTTISEQNAQFNLNEINFSFENIPKDEAWYKTFRRKDTGNEKYVFVDDDNYWDPFVLPYQLDYVPPLDPKVCLSTYNRIKKVLIEPTSTSTSAGPSTPDPNTSNSTSSIDLPYTQDEDSKISATMTETSTSTIDELKPVLTTTTTRRKKRSTTKQIINDGSGSGKNPRKSPRQHASTLAILSSLIQQRKRKSRSNVVLPTIVEEDQQQQQQTRYSRSPRNQRYHHRRRLHQNRHGKEVEEKQQNQQEKVDYFAIAKNLDDELSLVLDENLNITEIIDNDDDDDDDDSFIFNNNIDVIDLLNNYDANRLQQQPNRVNCCSIASGSGGGNSVGGSGRGRRPITGNRPGRKPGRKKKKNRTGWPNRNIRRIRRDHLKDDDLLDDSTLDSVSVVNPESEGNEEICENNTTDSISNKQQQRLSVNRLNSENNNDQSSLNDSNKDDADDDDDANRINKLNDLNNGDDAVLTDKVDSNNVNNMQYETYVCVQKLDTLDNNNKQTTTTTTTTLNDSDGGVRRSTSPKRTNRGHRRMPASPKSPRMLRRPRGRWYRER